MSFWPGQLQHEYIPESKVRVKACFAAFGCLVGVEDSKHVCQFVLKLRVLYRSSSQTRDGSLGCCGFCGFEGCGGTAGLSNNKITPTSTTCRDASTAGRVAFGPNPKQASYVCMRAAARYLSRLEGSRA